MELTYFHLIPNELLGIISNQLLLNESSGNDLFIMIEAFPDLKGKILDGVLFNNNDLHKSLIKISKYTGMNIYEILELLIKYLSTYEYAEVDDNIIDKYHILLQNLREGYYDPAFINFDFINDDKTRDIFTILFFIDSYPSVLDYIYNRGLMHSIDLTNLYNLLYNITQGEDFYVFEGLDEDILIDIIPLWSKDSRLPIDSIVLTEEIYEELKNDGKYDKLIKFLLDNKVRVI